MGMGIAKRDESSRISLAYHVAKVLEVLVDAVELWKGSSRVGASTLNGFIVPVNRVLNGHNLSLRIKT